MVSGQVADEVRDLGVEGVLDAVGCWHEECIEREVRIFVAATHFADLHNVDSKPERGGRILPGMERPVRLGGAGTPRVWEFAAAEFAARLGKSPYAGRAWVADALDVRHRLPRLWVRVCAGEVPVSYARQVAQQTRELSKEAAGKVDAAVAAYADGRLSWSRFEALVAGKVAEADPDRAAAAEKAAAEEEFARVGRSNNHGQKSLYARCGGAAMIRIEATLAYYATILAALGDTDTEDRRRAKALLIMANPVQGLQLLQAFAAHRAAQHSTPGEPTEEPETFDDRDDPEAAGDEPGPRDDDPADHDPEDQEDSSAGADVDGDGARPDPAAGFLQPFRPEQIGPDTRFTCGFDPKTLLPGVTVYLHLYARTDTGDLGPVARWEGEGPITTEYVRNLLGPAASFTIKPVIDIAGMAPVDGYEIPDRLREAVHLRTPADTFPWAANTGRAQQLDHTRPYVPPDHGGPPGQTGLANLGPMTAFHHRVKTFGGWQVIQAYPGIYLWRDRHGMVYLVDHTGTRRIAKTEPADPADPCSDLMIEFYDDEHGVQVLDEPYHAA